MHNGGEQFLIMQLAFDVWFVLANHLDAYLEDIYILISIFQPIYIVCSFKSRFNYNLAGTDHGVGFMLK